MPLAFQSPGSPCGQGLLETSTATPLACSDPSSSALSLPSHPRPQGEGQSRQKDPWQAVNLHRGRERLRGSAVSRLVRAEHRGHPAWPPPTSFGPSLPPTSACPAPHSNPPLASMGLHFPMCRWAGGRGPASSARAPGGSILTLEELPIYLVWSLKLQEAQKEGIWCSWSTRVVSDSALGPPPCWTALEPHENLLHSLCGRWCSHSQRRLQTLRGK